MSDTCIVPDLSRAVQLGMKFGTIYADPPWKYDNQATRAATDNHYDGNMSIDDLCALPVKELAANAAHLHLWTTNGFLFECPRLFAAWDFEFKSSFVWVKPRIGIGNYWRNSHELLLTAVRGDATKFNDHSLTSWLECDRGAHSAKPEQVRHFIERASPGPRLELFSRQAAEGWAVWGNQIERSLFTMGSEGSRMMSSSGDLFGRVPDESTPSPDDRFNHDLSELLTTHGLDDVSPLKVADAIRQLRSGAKTAGAEASFSGAALEGGVEREWANRGLRVLDWAEYNNQPQLFEPRLLVRQFRVKFGARVKRIDRALVERGTPLVLIECKCQMGPGSADEKLEGVLEKYERYAPMGCECWLVTQGKGFRRGLLEQLATLADQLSRQNRPIRIMHLDDVRDHVKRILGIKRGAR